MVVAWGDSQGLKTVSRAPAALKQVQGDKKRAVIPSPTRNRKIEVNKLKSCCRKRDFRTLAALKQFQKVGWE